MTVLASSSDARAVETPAIRRRLPENRGAAPYPIRFRRAERLPARWALNEASAAAEHLGNLPLVVLWGTEGLNFAPADLERLHEFQREIAAYSSNSVSRNVEGADHGTILGKEQYAAQVSAAILEVITVAQTGEPLTQ
jgi:hypothetical protein